jgi:hypothetical protein
MSKLKIFLISIIIALIIGGVVIAIRIIFPVSDTSQNSSSTSQELNFNLGDQAQSIANQVEAGIVEDSLRNSTRLNFSSLAITDLNQFEIKSFSTGSKLLKVDKSYFYNEKFYLPLQRPILTDQEGGGRFLPKDEAFFILGRDGNLTFLNYAIKFSEELIIKEIPYFVFITEDLYNNFDMFITSQDLNAIREYDIDEKGLFSKAVKKNAETISIDLAKGNGRNPEIITTDINIEPFVTRFFSAQSSSSTSQTPRITFGD